MHEAAHRAARASGANLSLTVGVPRTCRLETQTMQLHLQAAQDIALRMTEPGGSVSELRKRTTRLRVFKEKLRDAVAYKAAPVDFKALLALERDGDDACESPTIFSYLPRSRSRSPIGRLQRAVHRVCLESSSNSASLWDSIDVVAPTVADGPTNVVRSSTIRLHSAQHACESEEGFDVCRGSQCPMLLSELVGSPFRADSDRGNDSNGQESNPSNMTRSQQMESADGSEHQCSPPNMIRSPHGANCAQEPSFTPEPTAHRSPPVPPTLGVSGHSRGRSVLLGSMLPFPPSLGRSPDALRVRAVREAFMRTGSKLAGATRGTRPRPASALQLSERGVKDVGENAFAAARPAERRPRPASAAYPLQTRAPPKTLCRGRPCWVD